MRLRGSWFLALLALVALALTARWIDRTGRALGVQGGRDEAALRSLAFRIPDSGELEFDLPSRVDKLRVFAHAELDGTVSDEAMELSRRFALHFRFEGWKSSELERTYHFRSRIARGTGPEGLRRTRSRYLRSTARPLDARGALLSLGGLESTPSRVHVSLAEADPGIAGASVRIYYEESLAESKRAAQWSRLSTADRVRRSAGNIYPHYLLTPRERQTLIGRRWLPVAPSGVPGKDYERRIVLLSDLSLPPAERSAGGSSALPDGVVGVVRIESGETLDLEASTPDGNATAIRARFLSDAAEGVGERAEPVGVETADGTVEIRLSNESGWLVVESPASIELRSRATGGGGSTGSSPLAVESIRGFECSGGGLGYRVVHLPGRPTPIRVDLRWSEEGDASAEIELLDARGERLSNAQISAAPERSRFDWLEVEGQPVRISEPVRRYLAVPPAVERLEISCSAGGYVALYNQDPDLVFETRLPASEGATTPRRWSPLLPTTGTEVDGSPTSARLRLQRRPPPALTAGSVEGPAAPSAGGLESFEFPAEGAGRHLLIGTEATSGPPASWRYRRIVDGGEETLEIGNATTVSTSVRPTLLFRREATSPFPLQVEIDGRLTLDEEWAGSQGELTLPAIRPGSRRVVVRGDGDVRFFLNWVGGTGGARFVRRFVEPIPSKPFEITVEKRGSTVITGRLYFADGSRPSCKLEASVRGAAKPLGTPLTDWTLSERRYEIAPAADRIALLGGDEQWVDRSDPFFFRLGEDLPDGSVRVRFTPLCSESIFLTLSRLADGTAVERRLIFESNRNEPL